ncbi:MAG: CsgG/HfaB family protein [Planctomycetaceae bacterium]|nr:CsgG/HfaB family protein [Planctomycetaceae bacterium]
MSMRHQLIMFALVVGLVAALGGAAQGQSRPAAPATVSLAIVSGQSSHLNAIEAALLAGLSNDSGVALVERQHLARVLDERRLAMKGLTDPATAAEVGRLVKADAFCILEIVDSGGRGASAPSVYVRVLESSSGMLLNQTLQSGGGAEAAMAAVRQGIAKMRTGGAQRRYVSVLEVRSQDLRRDMDDAAAALGQLLEHDLSTCPQVVVLERRQLARLRQEQVLTGAELDLKRSTVLVEVSLQRLGTETVAEIRLRPLAGGEASMSTERFAGTTVPQIRAQLFGKVAALLKAVPPAPAAVSARRESLNYALQSRLRVWQGDLPDALRLAQTAVSLHDSVETRRVLWRVSYAIAFAEEGSPTAWEGGEGKEAVENGFLPRQRTYLYPLPLRVEALKRLLRMDTAMVRANMEDPTLEGRYECMTPMRGALDRGLQDQFAQPGDRAKVLRIADELRELYLAHYETMLAYRLRHKRPVYDFYITRVLTAADISRTSEEFCGVLTQLLPLCRLPNARSNSHQYFGEQLTFVLRQASLRFGQPALQDVIVPFSGGDASAMVAFACRAELSYVPGATGIHAAAAALDVYFDHLPVGGAVNNAPFDQNAPILSQLVRRLEAGGAMEMYFESLLRRAENESSAAHIVASPIAWDLALERCPAATARQWASRLRRLMNLEIPSPDRQQFEIALRSMINPYLGEGSRSGVAGQRFSPWQAYRTQQVSLGSPRGKFEHVDWFFIHPQEQSLLVGVAFDKRLYTLLKLDPATWSFRVLGNWTCTNAIPILITARTVGETTVIASREHGLFLCRGGKFVKCIDSSNGLPGRIITSMDVLDGRIYLAVMDAQINEGGSSALLCFDPADESFQVLANNRAIRRRHGLDGGRRYSLQRILADPKRNCLWLGINGVGRAGLWRYDIAQGTCSQVIEPNQGAFFWPDAMKWFDADTLICNEGTLLHLGSLQSTNVLGTGRREVLYRHAQFTGDYLPSMPSGGWEQPNENCFAIGGDLIGTDQTRDGRQPRKELFIFSARDRIAYPCPLSEVDPHYAVRVPGRDGFVTASSLGYALTYVWRESGAVQRPAPARRNALSPPPQLQPHRHLRQ